MNSLKKSAFTVAIVTVAALTSLPHRAATQIYQIDCAILLCLSGGWPASVPCSRARTEFIRRITPWPVEPPLQIWRCPMGAAYSVSPESLTSERIYEILFEIDQTARLQSFPTDAAGDPVTWIDSRLTGAPAPLFPMPQLTENLELQPAVLHLTGGNATPLLDGFAQRLAQDRANIDIGGPEFNFVRFIT